MFPGFNPFNPFRPPSQAQTAAIISSMKGGDEQQRRDVRDKQKRVRKSEMRAIWDRRNNQTQQSEEGFLS